MPKPRLHRPSLHRLAFIVLAASLAAVPCQAAPALIPIPREFHPSDIVTFRTLTVTVPAASPEDLFAAQDLEETLAHHGLSASAPGASQTLTLLRADSPAARAELLKQKLTFDPAMHDEGYVLIADHSHITIVAATAAGIFYGVQTLKQLIECQDGTASLSTGTIRDWPAMRYRGVHDDLSRGPFPTLAYQKHQIDVFAAHKVNVYSPYFEHTLQYERDPLAAPQGSALTRPEAHELVAYASRRHIMIVPEQEAFGHLHHVLTYEKYADVAETPHGHVLAPGQAGSVPLIVSWFTQIAQDFPGPFLHVGADETFELGTGRTRADVTKRGLGPVYADFLTRIHTALAPLDRRVLFWGDIAESDPASIPGIPKDMIAIPWIYWHKDSYDGDILPFKKAGIETWVAPGDANWKVTYPLGGLALDNISGFIEAGQRLGSTGELTVAWNDDGEGLFDQDWFGILFGAAAGWQPGRSDGQAYLHTFARDFYGDRTGSIEQAQRELMAAEDLIDNSNAAFWLDPWSPQGQVMAAKLRPRLAPARLHCERAIELIMKARTRQPDLRELPALRAMELGARHMDFIGLKFQLADEMAAAYATAYANRADPKREAETRETLYSISSMNGRTQDLRDGYSALKNLYQASWLSENRPYWLDNVLVRYDMRIQLWQRRGEQIDTLIETWQDTRKLPPADQAGLPTVSPGITRPEESHMSLFLAVDAGGTKADYVLADETRILARARSATIKRMRTDAQSATHALNGAFTQLQAAAGVSLQSVTHTCIGTAGVGIPLVVEFLRAAFHARVSGPLLLLSDVEIALDAAFPNASGVLVLAGTGSNVAARTAAGKISTFGGWGPFLADQGSGHSIGHGALRAAFLAIDRHQHTSLMPRILAALNLPTIDALGAFANSHPTPDVSRLAPVVLAAAQAGDSVAAQILHTQGEELGELACLALRQIAPAGGPAHLACAGSILQHVLPVRDAMTAYIHRQFPAVAIHPGVVDPIDGALWRARQLPESGEHEAP